ncbi:MAG: Valine--tRNA ligase [Dehalococcoidia bacterium]|nr:Valine--tRNA ligase [Chloroflexota bacterium]
MISEIPKTYEPKQVEGKWYQFWLERGYFAPRVDPQKKPFVIIMPPPNVTGELHLGHALTTTLEDILTRWHRMKGDPTLWLPGVDHASIATQYVVEQNLLNEGLTRHDLGRERFLEHVWEWVNKCRDVITEQHKRLGISCDWSRETFTMEPGPCGAVRTTFVNLYKKGLIYRGERITNWCPRCATVLSDLEVEHEEISGHLYHIRYRMSGTESHPSSRSGTTSTTEGGSGEEFITVATTRPETILGDTAVAVNPQDWRYRHLLGRSAVLPAVGREIPIIADDAVDPSFGTGAVKVTPAHDPVDFEIAQRKGLPLVNIMNLDATMNENAGPYRGQDRFAARRALLADLEKEGLLVKIEPYIHSVGHCQRCRTMVEPLASRQWFVRIAPLAIPAIEAVVDGRIEIIPQRFTRVYLNWMESIRDWCISRQLWWGHRLPVWYCQNCGELTVAVDDPDACAHCGSPDILQDPDILDTWFSSALWPHSTLGWPDDTADLRYFYPTSVLETGYDILFFWVARMIMMGLENTGEIPFSKVYLHGLIRDEKGDKMSKSRKNVLDPQVAMDKYGTDALRFALTAGSAPGNDMRLSQQKLEGSRNFANKLWNTARFILGNLDVQCSMFNVPPSPNLEPRTLNLELFVEDRWIRSRLNRLIAEVNQSLEGFMLGEGLSKIHDFVWGEFCDWYIELAKIRLRAPGSPSPIPVLVDTLDTILRLLHPFMPFITEELWQRLAQHLPERPDSIMIASYPVADESAIDAAVEREMESVIEIVRAIRNARAEAGVEPSRFIEALIAVQDEELPLKSHLPAISTLARVRPLTIIDREAGKVRKDEAKVLVLRDVEVILPLSGMVDREAESKRLQREIEKWRDQAARTEAKLQNEQFLCRAPADIVQREREKLAEQKDRLGRLQKQLEEWGFLPSCPQPWRRSSEISSGD